MRETEHDIAFFLALGCAIALHCIALHCIVVYCIALHFVDVSGLVSGLDSQSGSELPFVTTVDQIELRRSLWSRLWTRSNSEAITVCSKDGAGWHGERPRTPYMT